MVENKIMHLKTKLSNATAFARVAAVNCADADTGGVNGGWSACNDSVAIQCLVLAGTGGGPSLFSLRV